MLESALLAASVSGQQVTWRIGQIPQQTARKLGGYLMTQPRVGGYDTRHSRRRLSGHESTTGLYGLSQWSESHIGTWSRFQDHQRQKEYGHGIRCPGEDLKHLVCHCDRRKKVGGVPYCFKAEMISRLTAKQEAN